MIGHSNGLTVESIQNALNASVHNNQIPFYSDAKLNQIIAEATRMGYVRRISYTQAEWIEEGLAQLQEQERKNSNLRSVLIRALSAASKAPEAYQARPADRTCEFGVQHCQQDIDAVWQAAEDFGILLN